jgi:hypothetical protein
MGFLRNVVTDLVEKRLWPVALGLLLALAAVPVLLGGAAESEPAATAALPATPGPAPTARAQIAVDVPVPANREREGELRNPFKHPEVKAPSEPSTPPSSVAAAPAENGDEGGADAPASPPAGGGTPSGGGSSPAESSPASPPAPSADAPKADPLDAYRISVRFGRTGKVKTRRNLARLTPLPTVDNPFFVFLGVLEGGKRAVFLVSADAKPTGDGICKPSPTACETIELRVGDTEYFDLERESGPVQYELDLLSIRKEEAGSASEAVAARARASKAGAEVLQDADADALDGIDGYRFSRRTGLLERTPVDSRASADDEPAAEATTEAAPVAPEAAAAAAAVTAPVEAETAAAPRPQGKRLKAAVRAIVRGVGRVLGAGR